MDSLPYLTLPSLPWAQRGEWANILSYQCVLLSTQSIEKAHVMVG